MLSKLLSLQYFQKSIALPAYNRFVHVNQQKESILSPQGFDRHQHSDNPNLIKKNLLTSQTLIREIAKDSKSR